MKRLFYLLTLCLTIALPALLVRAESSWELEEITLHQTQQKIAAKEEFYLLIGRPDHVDTQLALETLKKSPKPVYYLNTQKIDSTLYKKFARKYAIKTSAYLGHFKNKKQVQFIPNVGRVSSEILEVFFQHKL